MARNKKNIEGEMGSGDSDDEFYNVKVPYDSGVAGDRPYGKSYTKKAYSPPRTKVKYDYKFDSSSDEESLNSSSKKNKKELAQKTFRDSANDNEKKEKSIGDSSKLPQSISNTKDKINEESHHVKNSGDKTPPVVIENVSASQNNMTPSMPSTVPRPQIGVVPSMVVMPPSMVVTQSPVMSMGSMIVPSAVGMPGQNMMPGAVNLIPPQNMMGVAGGMLRNPNPLGGLITSPSNHLPTNMLGINSVPNQMAGVVGIQGNFVGVPGGGAQAMSLQGGMINLAPMSGINMAVPGNMLRMAGAGNSMLRMQGPGGSIMGMQAPNNMLGISRPNSNIIGASRPVGIAGAPGNLLGVQPPTTGMIGNPAGMVVNPTNPMVGNPGNLMVMTGMMGNPGSMVGGVGNPNVVGANQASLMNKVPYAQGNSPSPLVPSPLMNVRGKPPAPGSFRWQTNSISQSNPAKADSSTATKSSTNPADREGKDDDGYELSRDNRDKLSDYSFNLDTSESQSFASELPNSFKNDGSFMEMFKKMREGSNLEKDTSGDKSGKSSDAGDSSSVKKPSVMLSGIVGKRRGGRVLKTGLVKKVKKESEADEEKNPKDAWSIYMAEVKKYREASCEEEGKTRPLVK